MGPERVCQGQFGTERFELGAVDVGDAETGLVVAVGEIEGEALLVCSQGVRGI